MIRKSIVSLFLLLLGYSTSSNAEQVQSASASGPRVGRYLGTVLYNGTNTECTIFANPVMAVGPLFGLVNVGGALVNAYYYNCHQLLQSAPVPIKPQIEKCGNISWSPIYMYYFLNATDGQTYELRGNLSVTEGSACVRGGYAPPTDYSTHGSIDVVWTGPQWVLF